MAPSITAVLAGLALVGSTACVALVNQRVLDSDLGPVTDRSVIGRIAPAAGAADADSEDNETHRLVKSDVLVQVNRQQDDDADESDDVAGSEAETAEPSADESSEAADDDADEAEHSVNDSDDVSVSTKSLSATEQPHLDDSEHSDAADD